MYDLNDLSGLALLEMRVRRSVISMELVGKLIEDGLMVEKEISGLALLEMRVSEVCDLIEDGLLVEMRDL